jgi:precorrin-6Y C5,15-methyltransferase (decarboxylating)
MITLIGTGCGADTLTKEAEKALGKALLVIGAKRLGESLRQYFREEMDYLPLISPEEILEEIRKAGHDEIAVLFSGDSGFFSGAAKLGRLLRAEGLPFRILPGISSVQLMSARTGRPWQEWHLVSVHGRDTEVIPELMHGRDTLFLTDPVRSPASICREITDAGLGETPVTAGEDLGMPGERISYGTAAELADRSFSPLSVLLVDRVPIPETFAGVRDREMIRAKVPMTKENVRAAIVNHLQPGPKDVVWDIGAGTGSVSVSLAEAARYGRVYAIEHTKEALALIAENRRKHAVWNLHVVPGEAPEVLRELPVPDAVFIGGSDGRLKEILELVLDTAPDAKICISAVLAETLGTAVAIFAARSLPFHITEIAVTESDDLSGKHLMKAQNPVWLISRESV